MLLLGLLLLIGAGVVGSDGVLANRSADHRLPDGFDVFGHTMYGTTAELFIAGIVVGAVAVLGIGLIFAGLATRIKRRTIAKQSAPARGRFARKDKPLTGATSPDSSTSTTSTTSSRRRRRDRDDSDEASTDLVGEKVDD